jgi:hypothetical protein
MYRQPTSASREVRTPRKIRYTDAEWLAIISQARACGRPPARYVRETSLGVMPRASRTRVDAEVIHELGRVGTTLARLVAVARETRAVGPTEAIEAALAELLAAVRRLG